LIFEKGVPCIIMPLSLF